MAKEPISTSTTAMRRTGLLIVALATALAYAAPLAAQSLADVAKKEEERRKEIKAPAKVLTNKDLAEVPPQPVPSTPATPAGGSTETPAPAAGGTTPDTGDATKPKDAGGVVKDQKYWSEKMKSLQESLAHDQVLADAMQTQISSLTTDFVNRDDPAQRAVIEKNRVTALGELNRLKDQIKKDQKAIDDLQEEARRAGVPPGWLR